MVLAGFKDGRTMPCPDWLVHRHFARQRFASRAATRLMTRRSVSIDCRLWHRLDGERISMARARIFRPSRTAMQQGRAKTKDWVLEFEPARALRPDNLMGWAGGGDTRRQIRLNFDPRDEAIAYAKRHGIEFVVTPEHNRTIRPKSYADNFKWDRPK
jgi:hypothetical protein